MIYFLSSYLKKSTLFFFFFCCVYFFTCVIVKYFYPNSTVCFAAQFDRFTKAGSDQRFWRLESFKIHRWSSEYYQYCIISHTYFWEFTFHSFLNIIKWCWILNVSLFLYNRKNLKSLLNSENLCTDNRLIYTLEDRIIINRLLIFYYLEVYFFRIWEKENLNPNYCYRYFI